MLRKMKMNPRNLMWAWLLALPAFVACSDSDDPQNNENNATCKDLNNGSCDIDEMCDAGSLLGDWVGEGCPTRPKLSDGCA